MNQSDYAERWQELWKEKMRLSDQRTTLETELSEITTSINHISEVLGHLAPLAGVPYQENIAALGITDAIKYVLEHNKGPMSAAEVRDALTEKGFDMSSHSAPMSSVYKILSRLAADPSNPIERESGDGGRVSYEWKRPDTGITDDDIPF
jgi:hypothetical protein